MKTLILSSCLLLVSWSLHAQVDATRKLVAATNQKIDNAVVRKDVETLRTLYADDFVFTHFSGTVDTKESWLKSVANPGSKFISRLHDSTTVEVHNDIAIVFGKLMVRRQDKEKEVRYALKYVRVFRLKQQTWQLMSHFSTHEVRL